MLLASLFFSKRGDEGEFPINSLIYFSINTLECQSATNYSLQVAHEGENAAYFGLLISCESEWTSNYGESTSPMKQPVTRKGQETIREIMRVTHY